MPSLRIVTPSFFADDVRASLTIPADVIAVDGEAGPEMAAAIADADVLLNGVFKAEWAGHAPRLRLIQAPGAGYDGIALEAVPDAAASSPTSTATTTASPNTPS